MQRAESLPETLGRRFRDMVAKACGERILEVRLFGSVARGEAREDSDVDVFVMVDRLDLPLKRAIQDAACIVSEDVGYLPTVMPLIVERAHFDELVRRERRIARDILDEGIVL